MLEILRDDKQEATVLEDFELGYTLPGQRIGKNWNWYLMNGNGLPRCSKQKTR